MTEHLFVYGTLAPNRPNAHILEKIDSSGLWREAKIYGVLEQKGWGADVGFPGLVLSADRAVEIEGFLFSSNKIHQHWNELDEFEGNEYSRQLIEVILENGEKQSAYVYALS
ncbi:gamma-glutamylcyclotransferase family protein [Acinetobacter radioresistens]|uniref:gamma-glutamylcyclotransferase family protein n=1 Tax=Acinetobacter radioresistens TaxID=40216 RepID=UPI000E75975B|nr:gamma-glutamylcyclotransferase family protein [Acinetobacter radioresistens]RJL73031.1 gamma-glutamylcyclotransferase [Acinetobacter radioresistens]